MGLETWRRGACRAKSSGAAGIVRGEVGRVGGGTDLASLDAMDGKVDVAVEALHGGEVGG